MTEEVKATPTDEPLTVDFQSYKRRNNARRDEDKPELREAVDDIYRLLGYIETINTRTVPPAAQPAGSPNQVPVLRRGNKTFTEVEAVEVIRDTINDWESCDLKIKAQWLLEFYDAHAAHPAPPAGGPQPAVPLDLHADVCQAVYWMNHGNNLSAHTLLREALVKYADAALATSVEPPPAASGPQTCVKCGHSAGVNSVGECRQCIDWQKHVCEFPAATTSAIEAAKEIHEWSKGSGLVDGGAINEVAAIITKHLNDSARPAQPSAPEPSSDAREVAREIVESYFMYSDRLLDKNALIDRITAALTSTRSELLKQIREAVEAEQVEDDGSGVWDAGHYDGINDALAAIDRVAKTSQTESTNQSETRAVDGEWQPPIDLTKHFAKHPHVSLVDGVLGGVTPIVSKIRISVTHVLGYLYHGKSIPEIGKTYSLSEEAVRDAIAFAHDVYDEVIHGPDDDDE